MAAKEFDIVLLTDHRYVAPKKLTPYISNILKEDAILTNSLVKLGMRVARKSWDDPNFDWSKTKAVVFRTSWDYFDRLVEFNTWFHEIAQKTRMINSKSLVQWNMDKHYFLDFMQKGIRLPKTLFIEKGEALSLNEIVQKARNTLQFNQTDLILKPCISGGARDTYKIESTKIDDYESIFADVIKIKAMMLQEFQANVLTQGEISLMVFDGKFTHAVLKLAKPGDFRVQDDHGGSVHEYRAEQEEIDFAEAVVKACPEMPIYARVDIFKDNTNQWSLVELEIFEPELWFRLYPKASKVLATALKLKLES
ncbi:MAG: hypothetical protein HKP38_04715 [Croceitalea sp.]|nr:hypothetical protein [Croceitalea sp.]